MKQFVIKIRLIFIPFIFISIATVAIYTFLNWLLFIKTTAFTVDEDVHNLFGPLIVPFIPVIIWLRPRIKLLDLTTTNKRGDPLMGYIMFAWMAMIAPTLIAQQYLVTATGKLTVLDRISQIDSLPKTKYYEVKNFYINKRLVRPKSTFSVRGKHNEDLDMAIYVPCPIFTRNSEITPVDNYSFSSRSRPLVIIDGHRADPDYVKSLKPDSIQSVSVLKGAAAMALYGNAAKNGVLIMTTKRAFKNTPAKNITNGYTQKAYAWIAFKYEKTISNHLSSAEKDSSYAEFARESQTDFNAKQLDDFVYLDRIGQSTDLKNYTKAIKADSKNENEPVIVLSPVKEPFESRNGDKLPWIFGSIAIGSLVYLIALLFKPLKNNEDEENETSEQKEDSSFNLKDLSFFIPREGYYATPIIINLNLLIYIIMVCAGLGFISFSAPDLLKWGGNFRPSTLSGQYWRLLTNTFLHGGLLHVLFNMYGLLFVGIFLEPVMGTKKYVAAYLGTGIIASIASIWWHPATVSVGASGAIFGMYGIFLALLTTNLFPKDFKKSFLISTSIFIGYNLLNGLTGGIDNAAHIGGLASGLIIGYALYPSLKNKARQLESQAETQKFLDDLSGKH